LLCPPTTQSKKSIQEDSAKWKSESEHKFVEKYLKTKRINSEKNCIFAEN
jgi:hypothetical protein